jgi:small-conductance mechanosensitive channel
VLSLALIIVFLLIFGIETSKLLVFFTSVFIPSVFIFGNSARSTFEALVFLFVVHPFDVGDRIFVDGQSMIVEVFVQFSLIKR